MLQRRKGEAAHSNGAAAASPDSFRVFFRSFFRSSGVSFQEALELTPKLAGGFFHAFIHPGASLAELAEQKYPRRTYLLAFLLWAVPCYFGMAAYYMLVGYRYFNPRYLLLMPTLGILAGALSVYLFQLVLYFVWQRGKLVERKMVFLRFVLLIYAPTPIAWLAYPLKSLLPMLDNHVFYLSVAIAAYMSYRAFREAMDFRTRDLAVGVAITATLYLGTVFFLPEIAAGLVRTFAL